MYTEEGYAENFDLATILSITTPLGFENDFGKITQLMYYIFGSDEMGPLAMAFKRDEAVEHNFSIHPELQGIRRVPRGKTIESYLAELESKFGKTLPITQDGYLLPTPKEESAPERTLKPNKNASQN